MKVSSLLVQIKCHLLQLFNIVYFDWCSFRSFPCMQAALKSRALVLAVTWPRTAHVGKALARANKPNFAATVVSFPQLYVRTRLSVRENARGDVVHQYHPNCATQIEALNAASNTYNRILQ
jgi:predicted ATP-grasp superfamily ATP-dependent carboligase